ncbi:MAG TPA: DEAD/DEAH box helicase [Ilumatobacter sp.]|nr:DEAD/DEAH box helicase [Ilumatobacter sp.]
MRRWISPQASLDALAGTDGGGTSRWVDFLIGVPWAAKAMVVEIDGSGHVRRVGVDRVRDDLLKRAGVQVERHQGSDAIREDGALLAELARLWARRPPDSAPWNNLVVAHGPSAVHRLGFAIVEAVERGFLAPAGDPWHIAVDDPLDIAASCGGHILDTLSAVGDLWNLEIVPGVVLLGAYRWTRSSETGRFTPADATPLREPHLHVVLAPFTPPHAPLPALPDVPTVIVRGACLPVELAWRPATSAERRNIVPSPTTERALGVLVSDLFGHPTFRSGQSASINQVLAGADCVVLLPTGAGKSLVYQLAGLIQPGVTLVIDPLVSLIDDQERRLRAEGVDRVDGLHAARMNAGLFERIANGETLFAFLTPERFQSAKFREALRAIATGYLVNLAVIDEAHCVSEWGHDFRTPYLRLGHHLRDHAKGGDGSVPPFLALTGTASPAVLRDVLRELDIDRDQPGVLQRPTDFDRPNLHYRVIESDPATWKRDVAGVTTEFIPAELGCDPHALCTPDGDQTHSGLVFVPHTSGPFGVLDVADVVRNALGVTERGQVDVYSGKKPRKWVGESGESWDEHKTHVAERFKENLVPVLVSTKAFGMGIDKPNIRWTLHAGLPSSIEAFAQEAGRAGRNGAKAICALVASLPPRSRATTLLDRDADHATLLARFKAQAGQDDLQHQLYFHFASFPSEGDEYKQALAVLVDLRAEGAEPKHQVAIARLPASAAPVPNDGQNAIRSAREKALYRLALVGVVEDYTVDYGADTFTVELADYSAATIDSALLDYARRVDPGRLRHYRGVVNAAPIGLNARIDHHLSQTIKILYRIIEPARVEALRAMYNLCRTGTTDGAIRATINGYLGDGPVATILMGALNDPDVNLPELLKALRTAPPTDPYEWAAAATRQLESFGRNPALLVVRALGEAWKPDPDADVDEFADLTKALFEGLGDYNVSEPDAVAVLAWMTAQMRNQSAGHRWSWVRVVWESWDRTPYRDEALIDLETRVLDEATVGNFHPSELSAVALRRTRRVAVVAAAYAEKRTS